MKTLKTLIVLFFASISCYAAYISPENYRFYLHPVGGFQKDPVVTGHNYGLYFNMRQGGVSVSSDIFKDVTKVELVETPPNMTEQACRSAKLVKVLFNQPQNASKAARSVSSDPNWHTLSTNINLDGIYGTFTMRVSWSEPGAPTVTRIHCNSQSIVRQPAGYELYNFERFQDAMGKWIEVGPIHVEDAYNFWSSSLPTQLTNSYTRNTKIRDDIQIPVLIAGKEYPSIGVRALGFGKNNEFDSQRRYLKQASKNHEHLVLRDYNEVVDSFFISTPKASGHFLDISQMGFPGGGKAATKYGYQPHLDAVAVGTIYSDQIGMFRYTMYEPPQFVPPSGWGFASDYAAYTMSRQDCALLYGRGIDLDYSQVYRSIDNYGNIEIMTMSGLEVPEIHGTEYDLGLTNYRNKLQGKPIDPNLPQLDLQEFAPLKFKNGEARLRMKDGSAFKFNGVGAAIVSGASPDPKLRDSEDLICKDSTYHTITEFEKCYGSVALNFVYFIPDHIEISNFKIENFGGESGDQTGMTYIRSAGKTSDNPENKADMYATISFDLEVKDAEGKTPIGYTQNCYARDIDFRVNLVKPIPELEDTNGKPLTLEEARDAIGFFNDPAGFPEEEHNRKELSSDPALDYYVWSYELRTINHVKVAEKKEKDEHGNLYKKQDGVFTLRSDSWFKGKAKAKIRINFDRDISKPINPFEVTSDMFNITDVKDTIHNINLNDTVKNDNPHNIFNPSQTDTTSAKFYYGIAYSPGGKTLAPDTLNTTTYFGVYCDSCDVNKFKTTSGGNWNNMGAMTGWYINELHNQIKPTATKNFGYISSYTMQTTSTDLKQNGPAIHNISTDALSFSSEKAAKASVLMQTNPWLVHAPNLTVGSTLPTANSFNIVFSGAGYWAGKSVDKDGQENTTGVIIGSEIQKSKKSSDRINW